MNRGWQIKLRTKLTQLLTGRYGALDELNRLLLIVSLGLIILARFSSIGIILNSIGLFLLMLSYYRIFSRQITKRYQENRKYQQLISKVKSSVGFQAQRVKNYRHERYYHCPNCQQTIRVPAKRGKIMITCPTCQEKFEKRT